MTAHIDRLQDVLYKLNSNPTCPFCGHEDWVLSDEMSLVQSMTDEPDPGIALGRGIPAVAVACTNCGYVRLHWVTALERHFPEGEKRANDQEDTGK
jgi:hypothetical protein